MKEFISKISDFVNKNSEYFYVLLLGVFCYLFLFLNLGNYPLIDIDETRYVQISKEMFNSGNYIIPYLNFKQFLEKPPLYFWTSGLMFGIFNNFSIFVARLGNALYACFTVFFMYFTLRKLINRQFAMTSSIILLSSIWFLLFSHIAILDMPFCAMTSASIFSGILAFEVQEKNKKYFWWLFWFFMGMSLLAKGLIGIIIPTATIFFISLNQRKFKDIFKPTNFFVGLIIFLIVSAPWHILAWIEEGHLWLFEYFIKHHFARFVDSGLGLGRKQPFLFYVPIIILGIFPFIAQFLFALWRNTLHCINEFRKTKSPISMVSTDTPEIKMNVFASIWALFVFLMFSISSTKLPTYVLPLFPPISIICAYYWYYYLQADKYDRNFKRSSYIFYSFILIIGILATGISLIRIPSICEYIQGAKFIPWCGISFIVISVLGILSAHKNKRMCLFLSYVALSFTIITFATSTIFKYTTTFGQQELMEYGKIVKIDNNSALVTFDFPQKYSILEIYGQKIFYIEDNDINRLITCIEENKGKNIYIVVKNVNFDEYKNFVKHKILNRGKKYTLIKL